MEKRDFLKSVYPCHDARMQEKIGSIFRSSNYARFLCKGLCVFTSGGKDLEYPSLDLIASYLGVKTALCRCL